jgi:UDP-N-acetylmuramate dehydrogenase
MFQNPDGHAAARLLQDAGLRGLRVGGITVSPRHANFMVNLGGTARDAEELLEACESRVSARFGITLRREIIVTGTP